MARLFKIENGFCDEVRVEPKNGSDFSLEELQEMVEGYIEILYWRDKLVVCNEEGRLLDKTYNVLASYTTAMPLVGNVLICERSEIK